MKNNTLGLLIGGGLLFAGGGLLLMKKFYSHDGIVEPSDYRTKTKHNLRKSNQIYPNPDSPVKLNIPEDYGIGHQRGDQLPDRSWYNRSDSSGGKRTKRKSKKCKTKKR